MNCFPRQGKRRHKQLKNYENLLKIAILIIVKRLFSLMVLSIFLFNWIGYQLYTAIADEYANQTLITNIGQRGLQESELVTSKMPAFHICLYTKEIDADDLLEFTSGSNHSVNEIVFNLSDDLLPDHANKENQRTSFKCFNGEYYSRLDRMFTKYPDAYSSGKVPDRYLFKIPIVFLSPKDHPPQHTSCC